MNKLCIWDAMQGAKRAVQRAAQVICNEAVRLKLARQMCMLFVNKP